MAKNNTRKGRDASEAKNLPTKMDGKLDLAKLLALALVLPGSMSKAFSKFHRYSFLNMLLAYLQTGKYEPMATYKRWNALERNVIKGSKALFINHPKFAPERDDKGNVVHDAKGKPVMKIIGFTLRPTVFQMHQTDGPDIQIEEVPDWDYQEALKVLGIEEVPFEHGDGNVGGYSTTKDGQHQLAINPVNPGHSPLATAIHEIAHIVLGHTDPKYPYHGEHRGIAEFQAEATSYLVMHELGVDFKAEESRGYIQDWLKGRATDYVAHSDSDDDNLELLEDKTIRAIFNAVDKILVAGRKSHFDKLAESE